MTSLLRTCFCLGALSSMLVAFLILWVNSLSAFSGDRYDIVKNGEKREKVGGLKERVALLKRKTGWWWFEQMKFRPANTTRLLFAVPWHALFAFWCHPSRPSSYTHLEGHHLFIAKIIILSIKPLPPYAPKS